MADVLFYYYYYYYVHNQRGRRTCTKILVNDVNLPRGTRSVFLTAHVRLWFYPFSHIYISLWKGNILYTQKAFPIRTNTINQPKKNISRTYIIIYYDGPETARYRDYLIYYIIILLYSIYSYIILPTNLINYIRTYTHAVLESLDKILNFTIPTYHIVYSAGTRFHNKLSNWKKIIILNVIDAAYSFEWPTKCVFFFVDFESLIRMMSIILYIPTRYIHWGLKRIYIYIIYPTLLKSTATIVFLTFFYK